MARPIGDNDLEFIEDTAARAIYISRRCKNLVFLIDDPDALEIVLDIHKTANRIRTASIAWRNSKKEKSQ